MKSNWNYPTTVWMGENRINDLSEAFEALNIKKPLFVSDKDLVELSITICDLARPLSVTNNGLLILRVLQALLKSLILSFPTHIVVG